MHQRYNTLLPPLLCKVSLPFFLRPQGIPAEIAIGTTDGYSKSNETTLRVYPAGLSTDSRAPSPVIGVLAPPDGEGSSGNDLSVVSLLWEYPSVHVLL